MKRTVVEFDVLDSTNSHLKRHHQGYPDHTFVRAKYQEKGRGQFDRRWISDRDRNLLFSMLLKNIDINKIERIRTGVIDVLLSFFREQGIETWFKEPNDFLVKEHKIAGILIETQGSGDVYDVVIIGVGINVNQKKFESIKATSMASKSDKTYDLDGLFEVLSIEINRRMNSLH